MKKLFFCFIILSFISIPNVYGGDSAVDITSSGLPVDGVQGISTSPNVQSSPNVTLSYASSDGSEFALTGFNSEGTMQYGVNSTDPRVFQQEATALTAADDADFSSGWAPMGAAASE